MRAWAFFDIKNRRGRGGRRKLKKDFMGGVYTPRLATNFSKLKSAL
jgi:hypothetical protein